MECVFSGSKYGKWKWKRDELLLIEAAQANSALRKSKFPQRDIPAPSMENISLSFCNEIMCTHVRMPTITDDCNCSSLPRFVSGNRITEPIALLEVVAAEKHCKNLAVNLQTDRSGERVGHILFRLNLHRQVIKDRFWSLKIRRIISNREISLHRSKALGRKSQSPWSEYFGTFRTAETILCFNLSSYERFRGFHVLLLETGKIQQQYRLGTSRVSCKGFCTGRPLGGCHAIDGGHQPSLFSEFPMDSFAGFKFTWTDFHLINVTASFRHLVVFTRNISNNLTRMMKLLDQKQTQYHVIIPPGERGERGWSIFDILVGPFQKHRRFVRS